MSPVLRSQAGLRLRGISLQKLVHSSNELAILCDKAIDGINQGWLSSPLSNLLALLRGVTTVHAAAAFPSRVTKSRRFIRSLPL